MIVRMKYYKNFLKQGITIHNINTEKFKTNLYSVFLATPLNTENVTKNALIAAVLRRGTQNIKSQDLISKRLEEMYGASFDCGIEKSGDNQIIKFYLEAVNEEFLPEKEELTKKCIDILLDIVLNPLVENNGFKKEYVENEKENLKQIIESKIDNKRVYSLERCTEEMYKKEPYGLYKYGYVEDLDDITPQNLYEHYKKLISECKIDIFTSGMVDSQIINDIISKNSNILKLNERVARYSINKEKVEVIENIKEQTIEEHLQVSQGNLVIGLRANNNKENAKFITSVYNAILGGGANSKLFQNVREKESLAYTAGSNYKRQKNAIFIRCGIEIENYEKVLNTIKAQLEDIKNGNFTDVDIQNAKKLIIESIISIGSEQDTEITYYYGQELSDTPMSTEEYITKIKQVSKNDIVEIAKDIFVDTVYFLRN